MAKMLDPAVTRNRLIIHSTDQAVGAEEMKEAVQLLGWSLATLSSAYSSHSALATWPSACSCSHHGLATALSSTTASLSSTSSHSLFATALSSISSHNVLATAYSYNAFSFHSILATVWSHSPPTRNLHGGVEVAYSEVETAKESTGAFIR